MGYPRANCSCRINCWCSRHCLGFGVFYIVMQCLGMICGVGVLKGFQPSF
uniref:Uncharacterized protein n=1 Tax=Solanum lycopersicum TaxID=4081 RepID=A0A3Q7EQ31_SOLLC